MYLFLKKRSLILWPLKGRTRCATMYNNGLKCLQNLSVCLSHSFLLCAMTQAIITFCIQSAVCCFSNRFIFFIFHSQLNVYKKCYKTNNCFSCLYMEKARTVSVRYCNMVGSINLSSSINHNKNKLNKFEFGRACQKENNTLPTKINLKFLTD